MKISLLVLFLAILFAGCKKENGQTNLIPTLTTTPVSGLNGSSAISGGNISNEGGSPVLQRGVCWSTSPSPTITDQHTNDGTGAGTFTSELFNLNAATPYYVRAYASNTDGTAYGNEVMVTTAPVDIYIAGNKRMGNTMIAMYWKNGIATQLSDGINNAYAESIFVSGSDIYVAGVEVNSAGYNVATLWKNGSPTYFTAPNHNGEIRAVFISGNDIYLAGGYHIPGVGYYAVLWKNGVPTILATGDGIVAATDVKLNGTDVYVTGFTTDGGTLQALCWKNANQINLQNAIHSFAKAIFIQGADLYIAGTTYAANYTAKFWKNGVVTELGPGQTSSIFVNRDDIYVSGSELVAPGETRAMLWKNGTTSISSARNFLDVEVRGTDIYTVGDEIIGSVSNARLWKNNTAIPLTDGTMNSEARSLFLK